MYLSRPPSKSPIRWWIPFDPSRLRLSQDFVAAAGVKKILNTVPVRKPSKEWFIQTNADPSYRLQTYVIELKEDSETYLVERSLWQELASESTFSPRALFTAMNRQGVVFLWPIRLPGADGRLDDWSRSAMEAAQHAQAKWIRVQANMSLGAYEIYEAAGQWAALNGRTCHFINCSRLPFGTSTSIRLIIRF